jgi:hypothetical protein
VIKKTCYDYKSTLDSHDIELQTLKLAESRLIKKIFDQQAELEANDIEILTFKENA